MKKVLIEVGNYNESQGVNSVVDQFFLQREKFAGQGIEIAGVVDAVRKHEQIPKRNQAASAQGKERIYGKLKKTLLYKTYLGQVLTVYIRMILPAKRIFRNAAREECDTILCQDLFAARRHLKKGDHPQFIYMTHMYQDVLTNLLMNYSKLKGTAFEKYLRKVANFVLRHADAVVTICGQAKRTVEEQYGVNKVYTIYNCFSGDIPLAANPGSHEKVRFVSASHLSYVKGTDLYIEAVRKIAREREQECEFHFCGDGQYFQQLKDIIRENHLGNVFAYGNVKHPYLNYADKDVYVSTSRLETLPMGIIEAMKAGLPVLATNVGAISEIVSDGENGILMEVSEQAIESGILQMIEEKSRLQEMGKASVELYRKHSSPEIWVNQFAQVFMEKTGAVNE